MMSDIENKVSIYVLFMNERTCGLHYLSVDCATNWSHLMDSPGLSFKRGFQRCDVKGWNVNTYVISVCGIVHNRPTNS